MRKESKKIFDELKAGYGIFDSGGLVILEAACQAHSRMLDASDAIKKYGLVTSDEKGRPKENPACRIERDNRAAFLSALRMLNLDLTPEQIEIEKSKYKI
jgi:P27 family predicted phage terminase small subunit